ncbi:hypothetical protein WCP94_001270 [Bilophila wadsworthia]
MFLCIILKYPEKHPSCAEKNKCRGTKKSEKSTGGNAC